MTRQAAPDSRPTVLTVAGSDSGGGAGVQADLKTIEACGGFGTSAVTSVTAQNTTGVESTHVLPVEEIDAQCEAVLSDFEVCAVKTGMLATADVVELVTDRVAALDAPAVVDPVMVAASGDRLLASEAESAYEALVSEATLVTPNADEAAVLTDVDPVDEESAREAGEALVAMGADAALVKGGHIDGASDRVVDVLVTGERVETFRHPRVDTDATHGSGCTLSSAVATRLAQGEPISDAVASGIELLARAVRYNHDVGEGPGAVHHLVELRDAAAREPTAEAVRSVVDRFVERDIAPLVPEGGMDVVGATPYAERPDEVAAVDGGIARTLSRATPVGGVRFGASDRVAATLLAVREADASVRFGATVRYGDDVVTALETLDGAVVDVASGESDAGREAVVAKAVAAANGPPAAVVDRSGPGDRPVATLLASDTETLVARATALLDAVDSRE
jgi:hydroxymethylpyrimidine/phosphomethylpyrimidine kinase